MQTSAAALSPLAHVLRQPVHGFAGGWCGQRAAIVIVGKAAPVLHTRKTQRGVVTQQVPVLRGVDRALFRAMERKRARTAAGRWAR